MSPTDGHPLPQARLVLRWSLARTLCGAHGAVFRPPAKRRDTSRRNAGVAEPSAIMGLVAMGRRPYRLGHGLCRMTRTSGETARQQTLVQRRCVAEGPVGAQACFRWSFCVLLAASQP